MSEDKVSNELMSELNVLHEFVNNRIVEIEKKYNCQMIDMSSRTNEFKNNKFERFYLIPFINTSKLVNNTGRYLTSSEIEGLQNNQQ